MEKAWAAGIGFLQGKWGAKALYNGLVWRAPWLAVRAGWKVIDEVGDDELMIEHIDGTRLTLSRPSYRSLMAESGPREKWYLPSRSMEGQTVLDIGAGVGDTAWFFLKHGAKQVICVEPDPAIIKELQTNKESNGWSGVSIIEGGFEPWQLKLQRDLTKIDCEGGETVLLDPDITPEVLGTARIETHPQIIGEDKEKEIVRKFDLRVVDRCVGTTIWRTP